MKTKLTLLLLVGVISISQPNITIAQVNVQDSLALVDLYNSTDGPNWYNKDGWLTGLIKNWHGIQVSSQGRVVAIDLHGNNLKGSIPSSFGNLVGLTNLFLGDNQLTGSTPPELGKLTNLVTFSLRVNLLTGSIPPELGNLTNLVTFSLRDNQLTGNIPPELGNLTNLVDFLWLYNNQLTGSLPPEIGKLTKLRDLRLYNNQITGNIPREYGNLSRLLYLDLSNNQLSGSIPPDLGKLHELRYLYLDCNQLSGHIPSSFGKLKDLGTLSIRFNKLHGRIPSSLGNLTQLQYLILSHNRLSGVIPSSFSGLTNLIKLGLKDNLLEGTLPASLTALPYLQRVYIIHNFFTFDGMEELAQHSFDTLEYYTEKRINLHQTNNTLSVYAGGTLSNNAYKWFKDGFLYATNTGDSTLQVTESGVYNVEVTNAIATELTLLSDTIIFNTLKATQQNDIAAITALNKNNFSVYPNPAKTTVTIAFNETGNRIIKLTDVSGRVLQTKTVVANKGGNTIQLNVSRYAPGMYWVTIVNEKNESCSIKLKKDSEL